MFRRWSESLNESLAATLLQWTPADLPFREIAFAALCLASGGKHMSVLPETHLEKSAVYGHIRDPESATPDDQEFVSVLATGAHLQGKPLGTAPQDVVYWLDGVLVVLVAQLLRPNAVEEGISFIQQYCHENHINDSIDAVLISIEHVVLINISPCKKTQHTPILPLFTIPVHLSMPVKARYAQWYVKGLTKKLQKHQKQAEEPERPMYACDSCSDFEDSSQAHDPVLYRAQTRALAADISPASTFYALVHLFESAALRRLRPTRPGLREGRLPNELYAHILTFVTDSDTRHTCSEVSRTFRGLCQEQYLLHEKLFSAPSETCKTPNFKSASWPDGVVVESASVKRLVIQELAPEWFNMAELDYGTGARVRFATVGVRKKTQRWRRWDAAVALWVVAVGSEYDRRSLLPGLKFAYLGIEALGEAEC